MAAYDAGDQELMTSVTRGGGALWRRAQASRLWKMSTSSHTPAPGVGVNATWNYTLGSIVGLFVVMDLLITLSILAAYRELGGGVLLSVLLLAVVSAAARVRYCWFLRAGTGHGIPHRGWTIALLVPAVASWGLAFVVPEVAVFAAVQLWFSGVLFACFLPRLARWIMWAGLLALTVAPLLTAPSGEGPALGARDGYPQWFVLVYGAMLPPMLLSSLWLWRVVRRLDDARRLGAELAVTQERLRFAADLHDIQGHHLQVIALKAELAERTLELGPEQAAAQLGEIRLIAKEAMEETRALVAGLREVALADELENAREVLSLAGAECTLRIDPVWGGGGGNDSGVCPQLRDTERVLAFAVREATTNILRHSSATQAEISLSGVRGGAELVITNDGVTPGEGAGGAGSGIAGLRNRVTAVGGSVTAGFFRGAGESAGVDTVARPGTEFTSFEVRVWVPGAGE